MYYPLWWQPLGVSTRRCTFRRGCLPGGKGCTFQAGCYFQGLYLASPRRDLGPGISTSWEEIWDQVYRPTPSCGQKLRTLQKIQLDTNTYEQFRGIPYRQNLFLVVIAVDNNSDQPA